MKVVHKFIQNGLDKKAIMCASLYLYPVYKMFDIRKKIKGSTLLTRNFFVCIVTAVGLCYKL